MKRVHHAFNKKVHNFIHFNQQKKRVNNIRTSITKELKTSQSYIDKTITITSTKTAKHTCVGEA